MQPADMRRAWTCPACAEPIHYIAGQDPVTIHHPQCTLLDRLIGMGPGAAARLDKITEEGKR